MPTFRLTYRHDDRAEDVEADEVVVEDRFVILRRTVLVIGAPRDVVVRRIVGAELAAVEQLM